ncbi:MAG: thiamine pyrophosphate-dependent enzyme [Clostridia bacterium]
MTRHYRDYLLSERFPLFWCAGCGNGIIIGSLARALARRDADPKKTVVATGIGCFGKADDYMATNTVHGTHGRALAFASGIKGANPDLRVIALMGDGDCATIGGNHFLHAARRNIGVTAIVSNNLNYGMTGGQYSATTPHDELSSTSVYGNPEESFDLCRVATAAGASLVARSTAYHVTILDRIIEAALDNPGFSLIEVMSSCPVQYGRRNAMATPVEMMTYWKDRGLPKSRFDKLKESERRDRFPIGILHRNYRDDFSTRYAAVWARAGGDRK